MTTLAVPDERPERTRLRTQLTTLRRRRRLALTVGGSVALLFVLLALFLPSVYRATATILIEEPDIPPDMVRSTITSFGDKRIETIYQRVMTGENLLGILRENALYPREQRTRPREVLIARMRDDLGMEIVSADVVDSARGAAVKATIAFKVWYEHEDPTKAYQVANTLSTLFLNENLRDRAELASATTRFLGAEAEQLADNVRELEDALAVFKQGNVEALPELKQVNLQMADRAERDLEENRRLRRVLEDRKAILERQLVALAPSLELYDERGARVPSSADRLQVLRAQLVEARSRYSPEHPDIRGLEEQVRALSRAGNGTGGAALTRELATQQAALASLREKYTDAHPEVQVLRAVVAGLQDAVRGDDDAKAPTNPVYVQLRGELDGVLVEIAASDGRAAELQGRVADYAARLSGSPQVEREYQALAREYESARLKYADVRAKQFEAEMAEAMETDRKGERFELIEPPLQPEEPVSPNRPLLLWVGLLLAVLLGSGAAFVAEALDPRVEGSEALARLVGMAPIAIIPFVATQADVRRERRWRQLAVAGAMLGVAAVVVLVHFLVSPLPTLFWGLVNRLGWFL
jgi:uncharacterized protein involved in exopolysaccharide biosynthesis